MDWNIVRPKDVKRSGTGIYAGAPQTTTEDTYWGTLRKFVPAETIGAYILAQGIIGQIFSQPERINWRRGFLFGFILAFALLSMVAARKLYNVTGRSQRWLTAAAFGVWVFGQGGPLATYSWWEPGFGVLLVILFAVGVIVYRASPLKN